MFERYTEKARRVIFFARYEASQFGCPYIETEHLLLGLLREDKAITNRFLRSHTVVETIRRDIEAHTTIREKTSTSIDLPLTDECKRVLGYAAEEAQNLGHKHIGTEHLLLGLLHEDTTFAAQLLATRGIKLDKVREELSRFSAEIPQRSTSAPGNRPTPETGLLKDLTALALDDKLPPIVARDAEIDAVLEVLSSSEKNCAILSGPRGAGKSAIIHGVAQRIASGQVPPGLLNRAIFEIDTELLEALAKKGKGQNELTDLLTALAPLKRTIFCFDCFQRLSIPAGAPDFVVLVRWALSVPQVQCILIADEGEFSSAAERRPWLLDSFREIHVRPLDSVATLAVLHARKPFLQNFHDITYSDAALESALASAAGLDPRQSQLANSISLLDAAGTMVKLRRDASSPEIAEIEKRIAFITDRLAGAVANHEFEKARFYSDEERKERNNLRALRERLTADPNASSEVTPDDIQTVLSRWSSYPYSK